MNKYFLGKIHCIGMKIANIKSRDILFERKAVYNISMVKT